MTKKRITTMLQKLKKKLKKNKENLQKHILKTTRQVLSLLMDF